MITVFMFFLIYLALAIVVNIFFETDLTKPVSLWQLLMLVAVSAILAFYTVEYLYLGVPL